ncbi:MAG: cellulase family glycosylhydrolase [Polyangiaceae bacterium]
MDDPHRQRRERRQRDVPALLRTEPGASASVPELLEQRQGADDAGLQDDYAAMFSAVARQFAAEPYVLGYDLFNEPWPGTTWSDCLNLPGGCPALESGELAPAYAKAVSAIRAAGDHHLIFGEPFTLFNFGQSTTSMLVPGGDSNAGMSFHVYPLSTNKAQDVIKNAISWSSGTGGALLNTEWGATESLMTLTLEATALDSALVPWIFWSFCCELVPSLEHAPGATNLVASTASVLVQAYPLAVAGTPEKLTVDASAKTLSFTWSAVRAGGGTFVTGTVTTFEVPALTYPNGYTASVSNGWVISAPCAPLLTVAAMPSAQTVTVDVQPGGACR